MRLSVHWQGAALSAPCSVRALHCTVLCSSEAESDSGASLDNKSAIASTLEHTIGVVVIDPSWRGSVYWSGETLSVIRAGEPWRSLGIERILGDGSTLVERCPKQYVVDSHFNTIRGIKVFMKVLIINEFILSTSFVLGCFDFFMLYCSCRTTLKKTCR